MSPQKLIGDLPTIQAIGQSARSPKTKQSDESEGWTPEEVHDLVGRIGEAERQARTAEALDEANEGEFKIADAATNGVTASERQALAQALGEAAGAPPADAEAKGEELLEQAGADPAGGVSNEQVADAAEAAAAEGGHAASGKPGDANDGGKGDRGGSGAIPVQSLPVLEMIARLLAQYFGVEAYIKQAALLIYMFADDLVKDLVAKLEGLNDAFGDELNEVAADVNKLLDAMGPYMGDMVRWRIKPSSKVSRKRPAHLQTLLRKNSKTRRSKSSNARLPLNSASIHRWWIWKARSRWALILVWRSSPNWRKPRSKMPHGCRRGPLK